MPAKRFEQCSSLIAFEMMDYSEKLELISLKLLCILMSISGLPLSLLLSIIVPSLVNI